MSVKKVLFINQEIYPYLPASYMSKTTNQVHKEMQELGMDVRTFMPKFGMINERRNQLHEVIRLSGINIEIDNRDHPIIIKVATLQTARMQVYFLYNEDYFKKTAKELETISQPDVNDERCIFFIRGAFETIHKLMWVPEIVHCQGWVSAFAPLYLRYYYKGHPTLGNVKVVFSLFKDKFEGALDERLPEKLKLDNVPDEVLAGIKQFDYISLCKLAIDYSDGVIEAEEGVDSELVEYAKASGKKFLPYPGEEKFVQTYKEFYESL